MWVAAAMQNSIGIDSSVLMREAMPGDARRLRLLVGREVGIGVADVQHLLLAGQMMNQTLNHMMVPSHMPMPIRMVLRSEKPSIASSV